MRSGDSPPRRPVRALQALAGAAVAVVAVVLGIGGLLLLTDPARDPSMLGERAGERSPRGPVEGLAGSPAAPTVASAPRLAAPLVTASPVPTGPPKPTTAPVPTGPPTPTASPVPVPPVSPPPLASTQSARPDASLPPLSRPEVTVLNNSSSAGLARRAAGRFERAGWPVRGTGNFRGRVSATTVYYSPGNRAAARRFASTFPGVVRVLPRPAGLPGSRGLTVVLTRDFLAGTARTGG